MKKINIVLFILFLSVLITGSHLKAQWVLKSNGNGMDSLTIRSFGVIGNFVCAGTNTKGVSYSSDNGETWIQSSLNNNQSIIAMASNGTNIYAGAFYFSAGIYVSSNNGINWLQTSLNTTSILSIGANGSNIFAGNYTGNSTYLSTNAGLNWATMPNLANHHIRTFAFNSNKVFAGDDTPGGVYISTDNGTTWTLSSLIPDILSMVSSGNNIIAGTLNHQLYLTTNQGTNWTNIIINDFNNDYSLTVSGNSVFAATENGVFVSNNNGLNWTQRNEGLGALQILAICVNNNYIFAGTNGNGIYRRPLSDLIGIKQISEQVPGAFTLSQNYPNPFNPETKIKFELPKAGLVKIFIYDAWGREVENLVNEKLQSGIYETDWKAEKYPSGVYFYKLESGNFVQTKKMILIK